LMMMEIMIDENNNIFYIEINPRFWGPLQLALDVNPGVLELFVRDSGINIEKKPILQKEICWYAWLNGSKQPNNRIYPALADYSESKIDEMLNVNDIYFGNDTIELHGNN